MNPELGMKLDATNQKEHIALAFASLIAIFKLKKNV
jgi:hypothetical protein